MSWHYLQELEGESLEDICSGGEPLPPLRSKTTHAEFYCNGKLTESYLDSLSGTTSAPSTESRGEEKSMSLVEDSHARTSVVREQGQASTVSVPAFGLKCSEWFAKYSPDTSSWRTAQCSLFGDWEPFSEAWPRHGTMQSGVCWERMMSEHLTEESESVLQRKGQKWPTPKANEPGMTAKTTGRGVEKSTHLTTQVALAEGMIDRKTGRLGNQTQVGGQLNPTWVEWLMGWPIGWTDLKPLAMDKLASVQPSHGKSFQEWFDQNKEALETLV